MTKAEFINDKIQGVLESEGYGKQEDFDYARDKGFKLGSFNEKGNPHASVAPYVVGAVTLAFMTFVMPGLMGLVMEGYNSVEDPNAFQTSAVVGALVGMPAIGAGLLYKSYNEISGNKQATSEMLDKMKKREGRKEELMNSKAVRRGFEQEYETSREIGDQDVNAVELQRQQEVARITTDASAVVSLIMTGDNATKILDRNQTPVQMGKMSDKDAGTVNDFVKQLKVDFS